MMLDLALHVMHNILKVKWPASHEKVPNDLSRCHTKRTGAVTPPIYVKGSSK